MIERGDRLRQFRFELPPLDLLLLASAMRWLMLLLIIGAALWLLRGLVRRPIAKAESETT
jgi:hypothetical protein